MTVVLHAMFGTVIMRMDYRRKHLTITKELCIQLIQCLNAINRLHRLQQSMQLCPSAIMMDPVMMEY